MIEEKLVHFENTVHSHKDYERAVEVVFIPGHYRARLVALEEEIDPIEAKSETAQGAIDALGKKITKIGKK